MPSPTMINLSTTACPNHGTAKCGLTDSQITKSRAHAAEVAAESDVANGTQWYDMQVGSCGRFKIWYKTGTNDVDNLPAILSLEELPLLP